MGKIFVVTGKSATGKDTIYKRLIEDNDLKLTTLVSYTTRPIRHGEMEGVEYHFVSVEEMQRLKKAGKIIELRCYDTVQGRWYYFTANDGQFNDQNKNYILIGTLEQLEQMQKFFGSDRVIPVYIEVDGAARLIRSIQREQKQRNPKYNEVCRRFLADEADFSEENIKRLNISVRYANNNLEQCLDEIKKDIASVLK